MSQRGLIDQTTEGQPLGNEIQDAQQGTDEWSQRHYEQDKRNLEIILFFTTPT